MAAPCFGHYLGCPRAHTPLGAAFRLSCPELPHLGKPLGCLSLYYPILGQDLNSPEYLNWTSATILILGDFSWAELFCCTMTAINVRFSRPVFGRSSGLCLHFGCQTGSLTPHLITEPRQLRSQKFHSFWWLHFYILNVKHSKHGSAIIKHFKCIALELGSCICTNQKETEVKSRSCCDLDRSCCISINASRQGKHIETNPTAKSHFYQKL